jgi:hypothetical protein
MTRRTALAASLLILLLSACGTPTAAHDPTFMMWCLRSPIVHEGFAVSTRRTDQDAIARSAGGAAARLRSRTREIEVVAARSNAAAARTAAAYRAAGMDYDATELHHNVVVVYVQGAAKPGGGVGACLEPNVIH